MEFINLQFYLQLVQIHHLTKCTCNDLYLPKTVNKKRGLTPSSTVRAFLAGSDYSWWVSYLWSAMYKNLSWSKHQSFLWIFICRSPNFGNHIWVLKGLSCSDDQFCLKLVDWIYCLHVCSPDLAKPRSKKGWQGRSLVTALQKYTLYLYLDVLLRTYSHVAFLPPGK